MKPHAHLKRVHLPAIGLPQEPRPEAPAEVFAARLERVRSHLSNCAGAVIPFLCASNVALTLAS